MCTLIDFSEFLFGQIKQKIERGCCLIFVERRSHDASLVKGWSAEINSFIRFLIITLISNKCDVFFIVPNIPDLNTKNLIEAQEAVC